MILEIYNKHGKLLDKKDCGDYQINLNQLEVIGQEQEGNILRVCVKT